MTKSVNRYRGARFLAGVHEPGQFPRDEGFEAAFIGRSNTGKSSVINVLADNRRLAHISGTPGKTRLVNFFEAPGHVRLVDLPGYGFARVSADLRRHWAGLAGDYVQDRRSLRGVVLVADVRRTLADADLRALHWCRAAGRGLHVLLNKADKLSTGAGRAALAQARAAVPEESGLQLFSARTGEGLEQLRAVLDTWLFPEA